MSTASDTTEAIAPAFDVERVRADFPVLAQRVNGHPLAYLDNAASSQRPEAVIDAIARCYREYYANVHRGVHRLSMLSTEAYEGSRDRVQRLLGAAKREEIIFVRGTTDGINLVAHSYGRHAVGPGDEILVSTLEHHSNIVPWQMLCEERGAELKVAPINDQGEILVDEYERLLSERTRIVALVHVSNALGTITPVQRLTELAHRHGAVVVIDGAQAVPHMAVDVQALGCDFYTFSGHKAFGPGGIGVLYGREALLERMPPYQGGGDMIRSVRFEHTEYNALPYKFEAGTPNIADTIGLGAAIDYLTELGYDAIGAHEHRLLEVATARLGELEGVRLVGTAADKASVVSFVVEGVHAHDVGTILDGEGIAVRAGHHCTQPLMERFGVTATTRASFAFYNTENEIERLAQAVIKARELFG